MTDLSGMTFDEIMVMLGFKYMVAHVEVPPPPYRRKWMTRRAIRWRRMHPTRWRPELVAWRG